MKCLASYIPRWSVVYQSKKGKDVKQLCKKMTEQNFLEIKKSYDEIPFLSYSIRALLVTSCFLNVCNSGIVNGIIYYSNNFFDVPGLS